MSRLKFMLLGLAIIHVNVAGAANPPEVTVSNVRRIFHNGHHNAFTDLIKFGDRYYLAFRSCPDGHMVHPTSSIIVLASDDLLTWDKVHEFRVEKRDTRDPHFLVFKNQLFVYTGTWYSGDTTLPRSDYDLNLHLGYAAWTDDGVTWQSPVMLEGTFGHYIWRAASFADKAYLCGRRKTEFDVLKKGEPREVESLMLESEDGLIWKKRAVFQPENGDETAFQFLNNGDIIAIGRRGRDTAQLLRASPPYNQWLRLELDRYIGGPLLARWNEHWVVGGRRMTTDRGAKTSLCWLIDDTLHQFAELPSSGDNSYPGFLQLDSDRAVVSWYSSHEKDSKGETITAIYMADLQLHQ